MGIGYPDGQRVENWDAGLVIDQTIAGTNNTWTSPAINCSRYSSLAGWLGSHSGGCLMTFTWYADGGLTTQVGTRQIVVGTLPNNGGQFCIPNFGAWLQVTVQSLTGGVFGFWLHAFLTNRRYPTEWMPQQPYLIDLPNVALAANGNYTAYPTDMYAGPVSVWFHIDNGNGSLFLQVLNAQNVWDDFSDAVVTQVSQQISLMTPPGSWRFYVTNGAAAATTFYLTVQHSLSGSS